MKRRTLLKTLTGIGMAGVLPMSLVRPAFGATADRFLITISATGGWDPTSLIDPKGDAPRADGLGPINNYSASEIKSAGNLMYAPYSNQVEAPSIESAGHYDNFFEKHHERLLVINGIDTQTNGHDSGRRFVWSGKLEEGYPTVAALAAAPFADQPMAFISNGGYDFTASIVAPVRTASAATFNQLAFPNSQFPADPELLEVGFFTETQYSLVQQAREARLTRQRITESLPKRQKQMDQLQTVKNTDVELQSLLEFLPEEVSSGLAGQGEVAVAAFASGLAVSANLSLSGFDTHGDHDLDHTPTMTELLEGIDTLWDQIEAQGLEDKVTVVIGSDFGRTPFYNQGDGKDHWNITSVMAMGAGITGNRVIGATDENYEAFKLNPSTLQPDDNGIIVTPQHVHRSLRDFLGIQSDLDNLFPIAVESLDLFG
ncbi:MAG: DUF1501 domain-containing protein [Pseudomonadales bacterium]|nr:DUF1501 domain-containing protein [Pseudomonadales bacterium]